MSAPAFLSTARLLEGTWQEFERDCARLMLFNGFESVRVVGGPGDQGADVLAFKSGELWVVQCKFTSSASAPRTAVDELLTAGRSYVAQQLMLATSRNVSASVRDEVARLGQRGLQIICAGPRELVGQANQSPEFPPCRKQLRDYQLESVSAMSDAMIDTGRALAVLATGLGKTVVMSEAVLTFLEEGRLEHGRALVLAHTKDLVNQLHMSFMEQMPKWVRLNQLSDGERPSSWDGITFATIQSVLPRLSEMPAIDLVAIDEAHHAGAESFQQALHEIDPKYRLGVTATPWRGDGYPIEDLLGTSAYSLGIVEGMKRGYLSEVDYRLLADDLDWEFVQANSRNKYSISQLNRRLLIPTRDDEAARQIVRVFNDEKRRRLIVFSPSILHAREFAAVLTRYGIGCDFVDSEMSPRDRALVLNRFRQGELKAIVTVDLFNEGVDVPDVDCVAFLRVTHSRRIFIQQLGRGLRVSAGKDRVVVLDFVSDLRRMAEVLRLDRSLKSSEVERVGLGNRLVSFVDNSTGSLLREWILDQADLMSREGDPTLELPSNQDIL